MKQYLLGIDIGTSACKTAVFDEDGHVLATGSGDYPVYYPRQGWAEQNPEEWWAAVCGAIKAMLEKSGIRAEDIAGIGIDGQSWSAIPVDKNGEVLANTPIWMDTRAADICEEVGRKVGEDRIFQVCGNPFKATYFYHITGKLVSQYDRVEMHTILKHSWDVGSADSGGFYFYLHSSRSHLRLLIIHITYVFICTYNCCFHLLICSFLP